MEDTTVEFKFFFILDALKSIGMQRGNDRRQGIDDAGAEGGEAREGWVGYAWAAGALVLLPLFVCVCVCVCVRVRTRVVGNVLHGHLLQPVCRCEAWVTCG